MGAAGTADSETRIDATTYELGDLVERAWSGRVHVPRFQRGFRWSTRNVLELFDSIARGYPVGTFLLWARRTPGHPVTLGSLRIDAPAHDEGLWVLDGVQRMTALASALHPEGHRHEPFSVHYDLAERRFVPRPRTPGPQHVPLPVLFDLKRLLTWFRTEGGAVADMFGEAERIASALHRYRVPAYLVREDDPDVLAEITARMNLGGEQPDRAGFSSALRSALRSAPRSAPYEVRRGGAEGPIGPSQVAERVMSRTGFGPLDGHTVNHAVLACRAVPEPGGEYLAATLAMAEEALVRAISFLRSEAGVPHLALLAHRDLLPVLARFFACFPEPAPNTLRLLRRLYWRMAVSAPVLYGGTSPGLGRELCARIREEDEYGSVRRLIDAVAGPASVLPPTGRFSTDEAGTKLILSAWWSLRPRSLLTGEVFDTHDLSVRLEGRRTADRAVRMIFEDGPDRHQDRTVANTLFQPTSAGPGRGEIPAALEHRPAHLDGRTWNAVLDSHLVDQEMIRALAHGDRERFLSLRGEKITAQVRSFAGRMAEWGYEDTPSLESLDFDDIGGPADLGHGDDRIL